MSVPPPQPSPQPPGPRDDEPITGVFPASRDFVREQGRLNDVKLTVAMVVVAVSTAFGAYRVVIGEARAQTDAGVASVSVESKATQRELERYQHESGNRLDRLEQGQSRTDAKLDALLVALRVPNPAPAPKDGGQ